MTAPAANSGEQLDHIAPIDAVARKATSVSGMFGMYETTQSHCSTPSSRRYIAKLATVAFNSAQVSSLPVPGSDLNTTATSVGATSAHLSISSARLSSVRTNQR